MGASESKLAFKEDIFRLAGEGDIAAADPLWTRFYKLPETADDVFALWTPNDLRALISDRSTEHTNPDGSRSPSKNVETLIYAIVEHLEELQNDKFREKHGNTTLETLNCVRILARLLPYIYESSELSAWEDRFFWQDRKATWLWDKRNNRQGPLFDGLHPRKALRSVDSDSIIDSPLGEHLIDLLLDLLFFPGFALPQKFGTNGIIDNRVTYSIWQSGIGCKNSVGMTKDNERNALEVLRLVLVLTSRMMYLPPGNVAQYNIRALTYMTTRCSRQIVLSLLCSLLNTVLRHNPTTWRVPLDISGVIKDPGQQLVTYSLQVMLVLIIYSVPNDEPNAFRKALSRLHRIEDFQIIQQGLTAVLAQPINGAQSYIPGISKSVSWSSEMLILFWELLQCNKRFRNFIVESDLAHDFAVMILYYAVEAKDLRNRHGIVRMSILVLQTLSVEPSFGKRLNKRFRGQEALPAILRIQNFHGTYADFIITHVHSLLTTTKNRLESIYPPLLAVLNNIAPYVENLSNRTSTKLVELVAVFAAPSLLLAAETNHVLLHGALEIINSILLYQYASNRGLIQTIVRHHRQFEQLRDFTVDGALTELDKLTQERKDRGGDDASGSGRTGSFESVRSPVPARSPGLGNVPEHGAFAIGDDEDDEDDTLSLQSSRASLPDRSSNAAAEQDAMPVQSRSMSEKARGKQPIGQGSFSRSASRNVSTTSLPTIQHTNSESFTPSAEWLGTWLPHLPLHDVLLTIETEKPRMYQQTARQPPPDLSTEYIFTAEEPIASPLTDNPGPIKVQTFSWNPLALGWYLSMLWGFIYAQDAYANRGSNGLWTSTAIRLFSVQSRNEGISLRSPKGAVDAVGDSLARRISGLGFGGSNSPAPPAQPSTREI